MVGERLRQLSDRDPIWRRIENRVDDKASNLRNRPSKRLQKEVPKVGQRNFGEGLGAGFVQAGIAKILKETVGIPLGSDTEIVDTEPVEGGVLYTVNVDGPIENMSKARAFIEATTGFTSILTDELNVQNTEVLKTRVLRDTYQVEVLVED